MALLSIILIAASSILLSGLKSWTFGEQQIDVVQNIRVGMDDMVREFRTATVVKTANSNYIVITLQIRILQNHMMFVINMMLQIKS
jgi:hypothetical protein